MQKVTVQSQQDRAHHSMILLLWSNNIRPHHLEGLEWHQDFSGWTKASKNPKLLNSWNPLFPKPMTYPMIIAFSIHQTSSNKGLESSTAQPRRGTTCDKQRVGNKKEDCLRQIYNQNDTTLSSLTSTWPIIQPEQYSDPLISQAMMASGGRKLRSTLCCKFATSEWKKLEWNWKRWVQLYHQSPPNRQGERSNAEVVLYQTLLKDRRTSKHEHLGNHS